MVLNNKKDSSSKSICFTTPEARFLLKLPVKIKEQARLLDICQAQRSYQDSIHLKDSATIATQIVIIKNNEEISTVKKIAWDGERESMQRDLKKERRQKIIVMIASSLLLGVEIYINIRR